jgi:hypothetical protein
MFATVTAVVCSTTLSMAQEPAPEPGKDCVKQFEDGQRLRKDGKLKAAAEALIACSQPSCPAFISKECTNLYTEAQTSLPSITVRATDGKGQLLTTVNVYMDGELVSKALDGRAISADPGVHEFRFEVEGKPTVTNKVLVSEGEKNKIVSVDFPAPMESKSETKPVTITPPPSTPEKSSPPIAAYVVGGLGIAAAGTGGVLYFLANKNYDDAEGSCAKTAQGCSQSRADSIDLKYNLSYVAFGVGGAALITSGVLFLVHGGSSKEAAPPTTGLSVFPLAANNGWAASYSGRF